LSRNALLPHWDANNQFAPLSSLNPRSQWSGHRGYGIDRARSSLAREFNEGCAAGAKLTERVGVRLDYRQLARDLICADNWQGPTAKSGDDWMTTETLSLAPRSAQPRHPRSGVFRRIVARFVAAAVLVGIYGLGTIGVSGLVLTASGISASPAQAQRRRRGRRGRRRRGDRWRDDMDCWAIPTPFGWICIDD
jgi:hypothetical protein